MDERLKDALASAGGVLAEAMRAGLGERGLPCEVSMRVRNGRVHVVSASAAVRDAELGAPGRPPAGVLEGIGRAVAPQVAAAVADVLRGRNG
jgi:hypothetical protein